MKSTIFQYNKLKIPQDQENDWEKWQLKSWHKKCPFYFKISVVPFKLICKTWWLFTWRTLTIQFKEFKGLLSFSKGSTQQNVYGLVEIIGSQL